MRCSRLAVPSGQAEENDLVPFWLFPGDAKIERHVPAIPFSREIERLHDLRRALAIYRMVFGQSRQEDLIAYILNEIPEPDRLTLASELRMDLKPRACRRKLNVSRIMFYWSDLADGAALYRRKWALTAEECLSELKNQKLKKIDDLPDAIGVYGLADHLGNIRYIGVTAADSFRDRIYSRHVNGSEERSHKLACNYNIGRMWRNRKCADHVERDAKIAKDLRREFIRRHCFAACVPLDQTKHALEALEKEIFEDCAT